MKMKDIKIMIPNFSFFIINFSLKLVWYTP